MKELTIKQKAAELVKELPDDAKWEDLMYKIYVLQSIERGLEDSNNENVISVADVRKKFGLSE